MSRPEIWMVWRCHGIPCVHFYFLFYVLGKDTWMRASSATVVVIFRKCHSASYLIKNCEAYGNQQFERNPTVEDLRTWANIMKRKSMKVPWKLSLTKKYDLSRQRTLHQSTWYFTYCYTLLFLSNKPSF